MKQIKANVQAAAKGTLNSEKKKVKKTVKTASVKQKEDTRESEEGIEEFSPLGESISDEPASSYMETAQSYLAAGLYAAIEYKSIGMFAASCAAIFFYGENMSV